MSDRLTASRHSPEGAVQRPDHSRHHSSVSREGLLGVQRLRVGAMRRMPRQVERDPLPLRDGELGHRPQVHALQLDVGPEAEHVGAGDRRDPPFVLADPGDDRPVVEPDDQLHPHGDPAATPHDDPHEVRRLAARRHEVDHRDRPVVGLVVGLEHQGPVPIAAIDLPHLARRGQEPSPVLGGPQQGGEAGPRIEVREAEPVDRPVAGDQGRRLAVADQGIVLDPGGHGHSMSSIAATPGSPRAPEHGRS